MIVLDTNVISELSKDRPNLAVSTWFLEQNPDELTTTAISLAEVLYGLDLLPRGRRRERLSELSQIIFTTALRGKMLPFDEAAARHYGRLLAARRRRGAPMPELDAQIAAIAMAVGAAIATRNVDDFKHCGVTIINPWQA
jgi:predicted nucleic acid-binding protein